MATKKDLPLQEVLGPHMRNVDGPEYTAEQQLGVQKFLSALFGGSTNPTIKPVTVSRHHADIIEEYKVLSAHVGVRENNRTSMAVKELERQRERARKKRAKEKKAKPASLATSDTLSTHGYVSQDFSPTKAPPSTVEPSPVAANVPLEGPPDAAKLK